MIKPRAWAPLDEYELARRFVDEVLASDAYLLNVRRGVCRKFTTRQVGFRVTRRVRSRYTVYIACPGGCDEYVQ